MSTKTRLAYRELANRAYALHQTIWYTDDMCPDETQKGIKFLDQQLSDTLSRVPASDIDSLE
jgi:hypothetical protein